MICVRLRPTAALLSLDHSTADIREHCTADRINNILASSPMLEEVVRYLYTELATAAVWVSYSVRNPSTDQEAERRNLMPFFTLS